MTPAANVDFDRAASIRRALALASAGELTQAHDVAETGLAASVDDPALNALLGAIRRQMGDYEAAAAPLRKAHRAFPEDVAISVNLGDALAKTGKFDEALAICNVNAAQVDGSGKLWRLRAIIFQCLGNTEGAVACYREVVARSRHDVQAWNDFGNALAACGQTEASIEALERAISLNPQALLPRLNLGASLFAAKRPGDALRLFEECAELFPDDPRPFIELGSLERQLGRHDRALIACREAAALAPNDLKIKMDLGIAYFARGDVTEAEAAFRSIFETAPVDPDAHVLLALLYEHTNRGADLVRHYEAAKHSGLGAGPLAMVEALVCRRERRFEDGLTALASVPSDIQPLRVAELTGQFLDGLHRPSEAVAAFMRMNDLAKETVVDCEGLAASYRETIEHDRAVATSGWFASWRSSAPPDQTASPIFLCGFPRSGTTLLDTLLMGHPEVRIIEEKPVLFEIERELGDMARIAELSADDLKRLRREYFTLAARHVSLSPGIRLVDKHPLHINRAPLIHRLFPDAKFILALRHPLDVVLSCFMSSFSLNGAMANFVSLTDAARLYDLSFRYWTEMRRLLPLQVHDVRYEQLVVDPAKEMRSLLCYLDLEWHDGALDHRHSASLRGRIPTASYSQVCEPLYTRASGRWRRYQEELTSVIPVLAPWVAQLGYET